MLQQTQVVTVIPYFLRFMARFPDVNTLANASEDSVLELWSGLGYYSRARNLRKAAQQVVERHAGEFPQAIAFLENLPGVGRSTASAIAALAFGQTQAILDGNVKRVLARHAGVSGWTSDKTIENKLWALAESRLPEGSIEAYTQGMMDLGASLCTRTRPNCDLCPIADDCVGLKQGRLAQLPTPRPKKVLPERQIQMLILKYHEEILLEKRPPRGIWGGLLCFPEIATEIDPLRYCEHQLGFRVQTNDSLPMLRHTFTHFRLSIFPQIIQIAGRDSATIVSEHRWLSRADGLKAAVPSPVRRLLSQL